MIEARYLDIANKIESGIKEKHFPEKLPGVFRLAKEFNANPKTIVKAVHHLASKNILMVRRGGGTFVLKQEQRKFRYNAIAALGITNNFNYSFSEISVMDKTANSLNLRFMEINQSMKDILQNPSMLRMFPVDGLIFGNSVLRNPKLLLQLKKDGIPFLSLNRISEIEDINWVDYDNEKDLENILLHLISQGHKKVAYIGFRYAFEEHEKRMRAVYENVMRKHAFLNDSYYCGEGVYSDYWKKYGEECEKYYALEMIDKLLNLSEPPTALYFNASIFIEPALEYLRKMKFECTLSYCVEYDLRGALDKKFTVIVKPAKERAVAAVKALADIIEGKENLVQQLISGKILKAKVVSNKHNMEARRR